jgi:hypothetical protein
MYKIGTYPRVKRGTVYKSMPAHKIGRQCKLKKAVVGEFCDLAANAGQE